MLEGLNEKQSQAALAVDGPVIVFAGAGSGKTRTLTYRIMNMICNCHISPYNILAITFTNKATNVMRERLKQYVDVNVSALTISTFHSLCAMILRRDIEAIGYGRDFNIIDEEEQLKVIAEVLKDCGLQKKQDRYFQKVINYNKCFMTKPSAELDLDVFNRYEDLMKTLNMLDFEDLLLKVFELFSKNPEVLFKYQNKYKYILVDEFQDTNLVQYKIVRMLALKNQNLFVVGDDDQSIYSFRGTNYENMNLFKEDFSNYQLFTFDENYRSTQAILDVANRLITNNKNREPKQMVTSIVGSMDDVITYQAQSEIDEVNYVCEKICALKSSLTNYSDFAVLYRSSVLLRNLEIALIRRQVPYKVYGGVSYLRRMEVKDIVAYFKLMINHNDVLSFKRVVNTPARGIGLATVEKLDEIRKQYHLDFFEAIDWCEGIIQKTKLESLKAFKEMIIKYANMLSNNSFLDIFDMLISEIQYYDYLKKDYDEKEAEERIANLNEFKSILYTIENKEPNRDRLEKLREAFDDAILSDDHLQSQKENILGVTLSTVHSVKGLEYKTVFIIGMEEELFPNTNRVMSDSELEEERRIAYVAITRAQNKLFMTFAKKRLLYGRYYQNEPSRFLLEAIGVKNFDEYEDAEIVKNYKQIPMKKARANFNSNAFDDLNNEYLSDSFNDFTNNTNTKNKDEKNYFVVNCVKENENKNETDNASGSYTTGDVVIHKKFGEGIILGIENGIGNIFFKSEKCTKKILLSHPSISKK